MSFALPASALLDEGCQAGAFVDRGAWAGLPLLLLALPVLRASRRAAVAH